MPDQFQIFEAFLEMRRRGAWKWTVYSAEGKVIMQGAHGSRREAQYNANRALFQLMLTAPYRAEGLRSPDRGDVVRPGRTHSTP
jgi:hypothetical protein